MKRALASILMIAALTACQEPEAPARAVDQAGWMVEHAPLYLGDRAWRRARLEESLWRPELPYARKRLDSVALEVGGWDLLPEINASVAPVRAEGRPTGAFEGRALEAGRAPETAAQWRELGERVFWTMPMRRDAYVEWLVERPELWAEVGLEVDEQGNLRGLTRFVDARGDARVGVTCGLCHGEGGVAGRGSRSLDLGRARALFDRERGREPGQYETWGPGRVDVTEDGQSDVLTIKDLWGVPFATHINSSGAVALPTPAALALRFETQYVVGHAMEARPSRVLTWALTMYVLTLDAPPSTPDLDSPGARVFEGACAGCHDPARGYGGPLVDARALNSDPASALSPARGTGFYKTPSLIGVGAGGPYLHDGGQPTLDALLDSGHPFGRALPEPDRRALASFLESL